MAVTSARHGVQNRMKGVLASASRIAGTPRVQLLARSCALLSCARSLYRPYTPLGTMKRMSKRSDMSDASGQGERSEEQVPNRES